ncbi:4-methylaminobutanoate oxidase (formaldehyde-forming) [Stella humosa]|uniref:4-methylaminobutanoate oxidase (Formaldehyde-forming) n=1 Tax=Stella humosa TaxID=94 RepID=A0A3N1ME30_9PROT|nr:FAD-dependent oxidoreductase [Stella humosa]ROQ01983.1 4-methylaminobutanoate oxidase (formaldehyde-forming) [Stella humosa]BBK32372.1 oxidoreductase [Stella humosa]
MSVTLPARADVVIVGGGIIGCSIAYHLTKLGIRDVVLLERRQLTCGTTWHAAGLIGQLRASRNMTELAKYTSELLYELERETGQSTGFKQNGSVSVALNEERFHEMKRGASMAKMFGLSVDVIGPAEIKAKYPLLSLDGVVGGVFLPKDGQANPVDVTQAYAKGARMGGARVVEGIEVERILLEGGRAVGVVTEQGELRADTVVLAAGMWSRTLGKAAGVSLPLHAAEHFYIVTEGIAAVPRDLPVLRVPDECAYYKEDAGKMLVGAFEPVAKPWGMKGIPKDFAFDSLPPDMDHFEPILERAIGRLPILADAGIQTWFNGPESFTPDDRYLLGETAEVRDLFVACGFNSIGIQSSGGVGKVLAEWIRDRHPPMDLADVDVRRMQPFQSNAGYLRDRTTETLGLLYAMHWPFYQVTSARGARRSPFHDRLVAAGACMGEMSGWERPNWFGAPASTPAYAYSWQRQNWFANTAAECLAVRDRVALFDQASFAKFLVEGADALALLDRVSANRIDVAAGRVVYTQWLNARGGIEADLTITRLAETRFLVVTSGSAQTRDRAWLQGQVPDGARVTITDITSGLPMLGLMGPRSRELMGRLTGQDMGNDAFPFATSREVEIGYATVRASRITYVGELGWELYVPAEFAVHVFDRIVAAGAEFGLGHAGYHAMNACRMEKAYRHWGHDIGGEDDPVAAGLGFAVAWDKPGGFVGRDALLRRREQGTPTRRLVQFRLADDRPSLHHEEPVWRDGVIVGSTTSGMYGHRIGASLGMGYVHNPDGVTAEWLASGRFEIEVAWERHEAVAQLKPFYDPAGARIRG